MLLWQSYCLVEFSCYSVSPMLSWAKYSANIVLHADSTFLVLARSDFH